MPETVLALRQSILRPHQTLDECRFPGDHDPLTAHFGCFSGDRLISVGSIGLESPPGRALVSAWRLRGMATVPEMRGRGCGAAVLKACIEHAHRQRAHLVWCNARTPAVEFYRRHGFKTIGAEFVLPEIGPHYLMECQLRGAPPALNGNNRIESIR